MKKQKQKEVGFRAKEKNQERNNKQVASEKNEREGVQPQTPQSMHHFSWVWVKSALISLSKTRGHGE